MSFHREQIQQPESLQGQGAGWHGDSRLTRTGLHLCLGGEILPSLEFYFFLLRVGKRQGRGQLGDFGLVRKDPGLTKSPALNTFRNRRSPETRKVQSLALGRCGRSGERALTTEAPEDWGQQLGLWRFRTWLKCHTLLPTYHFPPRSQAAEPQAGV